MPRVTRALALAASLWPAASLAEEAAHLCPDPNPEALGCAPIAPPIAPAPGRIAFVDPETGEVLTGEAAAEAALEEANSAFVEAVNDQLAESFSAEGLEEERTETGAVAVDLEGRFQSPLVATITPEAGIAIQHGAPAQD